MRGWTLRKSPVTSEANPANHIHFYLLISTFIYFLHSAPLTRPHLWTKDRAMAHDILDNHGAYSKFIATEGLRISDTATVEPYLLERELKERLDKAPEKVLERVARQVYGGVGYRSPDLVKEYLNVCIESLGQDELKRALSLIENKGLRSGLLYIVKL